MTIDTGADRIIAVKDAQTKAAIAGLETRARSGSRYRDKIASYSDGETARKLKNEVVIGVLALIVVLIVTYVFFFVIL